MTIFFHCHIYFSQTVTSFRGSRAPARTLAFSREALGRMSRFYITDHSAAERILGAEYPSPKKANLSAFLVVEVYFYVPKEMEGS